MLPIAVELSGLEVVVVWQFGYPDNPTAQLEQCWPSKPSAQAHTPAAQVPWSLHGFGSHGSAIHEVPDRTKSAERVHGSC